MGDIVDNLEVGMTEIERLINMQMQGLQSSNYCLGLYGLRAASIPMQTLQQKRIFTKPKEYTKAVLRKTIVAIANNGYIRRVI